MKDIDVKEFIKDFQKVADDFHSLRISNARGEVMGMFYPEILHREGGKLYTGDLKKEVKGLGHKLEDKNE